MQRLWAIIVVIALGAGATPALAQQETLADIRQELNLLYVEVQRLKRELSTTGGVNSVSGGDTVLQRVDLIEAELVRLTSLTENLQNRVNRIVSDGTTRIGDLEFRLVELEGGDVSQLGETTTLGGDVGDGGQPDPTPSAPQGGEQVTELAIGEQADFDAARTALDAGNYQEAAVKFTVFTEAYPVGPLTGEAHFLRGEALSELGDTTNAARAYLESFSGAPDSPRAPEALFQLGISLNKLGQFNEACISLGQVSVLYPGAAVAEDASATAREIGCG